MTASISSKDKGWNALRKTLAKMGDNELVVGIPGEIDFKVPTQGAIGAVHEFGSEDGTIPERSFLRSTFDVNVHRYNRSLAQHIRRAVSSKSPQKQALFRLGETVRKDVVKRIKSGDIAQNLKEATKRAFVPNTKTRRGDGPALVSTGTLVGSIVSVVRRKTR